MAEEERPKLGFREVFTLNMLNMFGTGPFITLPFLLDSVTPAGPHALIGYACAAALCFVDSMVYEMERGDPTLDEMMAFIKPTAGMRARSHDTSGLSNTLDLRTTEMQPITCAC